MPKRRNQYLSSATQRYLTQGGGVADACLVPNSMGYLEKARWARWILLLRLSILATRVAVHAFYSTRVRSNPRILDRPPSAFLRGPQDRIFLMGSFPSGYHPAAHERLPTLDEDTTPILWAPAWHRSNKEVLLQEDQQRQSSQRATVVWMYADNIFPAWI
jgi:hypothetical protein